MVGPPRGSAAAAASAAATAGSQETRRPAAEQAQRSGQAITLIRARQSRLLDPPCLRLRLSVPRIGPGVNVLDLLVYPEQDVRREPEVVGLLLVEDLIGRLDGRFAISLRAVHSAIVDG